MAAVTQTASPYRHVIGDLVARKFSFTGSSGDTLQTGMQQILWLGTEPGSLITAIAQANTSKGVEFTITSSAPMTDENLLVIARVG